MGRGCQQVWAYMVARGSCHATHCMPYIIVVMPGWLHHSSFLLSFYLVFSQNSQSQSLLYDEPYPHTLFNINHTLTSTTTKTQLAIYLHLPPYALLPPFEFPPSVQLCRRSRSSPIMKRRPNASEFSLLFPGNFIPFSILSFIILKTTL